MLRLVASPTVLCSSGRLQQQRQLQLQAGASDQAAAADAEAIGTMCWASCMEAQSVSGVVSELIMGV